MAELNQERLRELLHYDPATGVMTRRIALSNRNKVGDVVGCLNASDGYLYARVDGSSYAVHRLVWLYTMGRWPEHQINHINEVRTDTAAEAHQAYLSAKRRLHAGCTI